MRPPLATQCTNVTIQVAAHFRLLQHVRGLVKMWAERKRFGRTSAMAPRPPPPRAAMLYLYVTNLLLLASALAVVAAGAFSVLVPGGAAARASLAEMQGNLPADTAARLLEALEYAPVTLCVIGGLLAAIACAGCCSSFASGRCVLYVYAVSLGLLVCAEIAATIYAVANSAAIEDAAGRAIFDIWDKQCVCLSPDSARCSVSKSECFQPEVDLPDGETRACEPCQDYLIDTVCRPPLEVATADACAQRVTSALEVEVRVFAAALGAIAVMQSICCLCALRVARWSLSVENAERDEEALLAQVLCVFSGRTVRARCLDRCSRWSPRLARTSARTRHESAAVLFGNSNTHVRLSCSCAHRLTKEIGSM